MACPHCGVAAIVRTSQALTSCYREVIYQCRIPECGFSWVAGLEALRSLSPSGNPNPEINIPFGHRHPMSKAHVDADN